MFNGFARAAPGSRSRSPLAGPLRPQARVLVTGNEKGGSGKSTLAALIATAALYRGRRVAVLDLDLRQQSLSRLMQNRRRWLPAAGVPAPMPLEYKLVEDPASIAEDHAMAVGLFDEAMELACATVDLVVIDTPGGDTPVSRAAHARADLLVTPMNDSFVDFDVLGTVDPVTFRLERVSHYARTILEARAGRARRGRDLDWVVLCNRLTGAGSHNRDRLDRALAELAAETGFRVGPSLRERVIYREMFPYGLTLADLSALPRPGALSSPRAAAREEVAALVEALNLGGVETPPITVLSGSSRGEAAAENP